MNRYTLGFATAFAVGAVGCGAGGEAPGTLGELGEGTFRYQCVDEGDAVCNTSAAVDTNLVETELGINGELPAAVAVGARFDLVYIGDFTTDDGEVLLLETIPARSEDVHNKGGFIIQKAGSFGFLARSPKGIVADFTYVEAVDAAELEVWKDELRVTDFELTVGASSDLGVVAVDDTGLSLAGALPYTWTSSDPAVLGIAPVGSIGSNDGIEINDDEVRIEALSGGAAVLTVSRGEINKTITVTVLEVAP
jgi:hypothetical protein